MDAQALTIALRGQWHGSYGTALCPAHDDREPSLSIREGDDGVILLKCHAGCTSSDVVVALKDMGFWLSKDTDGRAPRRQRRHRARQPDPDARRLQAYAHELWKSSEPLDGTIGEVYLRHRGLRPPWPATLRYQQNCKHSDTGLSFPAIIAAIVVWPSREVRSVHRTYLRADGKGKAQVTKSKKCVGSWPGGAVRLAPAAEEMAIGEGLENCLSVLQETGLPTWAALSTSGLKVLKLPDLPLAAEITIAADHDENGAGQSAAKHAAQRWISEGRRVRIALPPKPGQDFNDILRGVA